MLSKRNDTLRDTLYALVMLALVIYFGMVTWNYWSALSVMECNRQTEHLDFPHHWDPVDGCKVKMPDGSEVDPFRYMILNTKVHEL